MAHYMVCTITNHEHRLIWCAVCCALATTTVHAPLEIATAVTDNGEYATEIGKDVRAVDGHADIVHHLHLGALGFPLRTPGKSALG